MKDWPLAARIIAKTKDPKDQGLGDTIHRLIPKKSAEWYSQIILLLLGHDCGCNQRRIELNQKYGYH